MKKSLIEFDDGSILKWEDRETLRYIEGESSALIWVDFEPGFFSRGRILRSSSIDKWEEDSKGVVTAISEAKKADIINKVKLYYEQNKRKCIVEE